MIFNAVVFAAIVLSYANFLELIAAAGNSLPHIFTNSDDLFMLGDNETSSGGSSSRKRSRSEMDLGKEGAKNSRPKYYKDIVPIDPKIENFKYGILIECEKQIKDNEMTCKWENFKELTKEEVKDLCIEAWKIQSQRIPVVRITSRDSSLIPDCEPIMTALPIDSKYYKPHTGFIQYLYDLKNAPFIPDLVRCNCAYLRKEAETGIHKTVHKSKNFFFLSKAKDAIYFVFTQIGPSNARTVKLVDVCELNVPKR